MDFKTRLKQLRIKAGLTQKELSELSNVSYSYLTKLEMGVQKNPSYEILDALGAVLKAPLGALHDFGDAKEDFVELSAVHIQRIPLLGEIAAGEPIYADEDRESYVEAGTHINADFCLRVKGDSMINARIHDGDLVFVRRQSIVNNGDIAVVIVGDEATLKRVFYYPDKRKLVLNSENPNYQPFVYVNEELEDVRILGKAIAFQSDIK